MERVLDKARKNLNSLKVPLMGCNLWNVRSVRTVWIVNFTVTITITHSRITQMLAYLGFPKLQVVPHFSPADYSIVRWCSLARLIKEK